MRKGRKILFKISGTLTLLTAFLLASTFFSLLLDLNNTQQVFENSVFSVMNGSEINLNSLYNFTLIYLLLSSIISAVLGVRYLKFARLNYAQFLVNKRKVNTTIILNLLTSMWFLPALFAIFAVSLQETKHETAEFNVVYAQEKRQEYFRQIINKDQRLLAMSVKINVLKNKLKNKEITEEDYKKLLNDILTAGISI